ncbi:MAG TPA: hypothetical protein EYO49_03545 [Candidatus Marinimicrobia bacterium]|nr:hypothetical protein [Candidatus Neomarinimicrobiota bacterium]
MKKQFYYGIQSHFTYIDWWHDPIGKEIFDHSGSLNTFLIRPSILYGISDKWNLMVTSTLGLRMMNWNVSDASIHHRTETSLSEFDNANGSVLGDSKIILRYLVKNTGMQNGFRIYTGGGLTIPSNSVLTSDPYFLNSNTPTKHRHFSLSNGTYNYIFESQVYYKRNINPTFYGGFLIIEKPFTKSEYGYLPPTTTSLSLSAIYKRFDNIDSSIGYGINILQTSQGYWNGIPAPNTKSTTVSPSITYLFSTKFGAVALNLQKPIFISGTFASNEGDIKQGSSVWQLSISFRFIPSTKS